MTFQEQLKALIPEDKLSTAEPIFEAMTRTFQRYDTDLNELKMRIRSNEGVKPEEFAKVEAQNAELKAQLAAIDNEYKKTKKQTQEIEEKLTNTTKLLRETSIEKEVRKAMSAFRIVPEAVDPVFDLIRHNVVQKDDGSFVVPFTGAEGKTQEAPVGEYMEKYWANTPFAKRVIVSDYSSGGGGSGVPGPNGVPKKWSDMSLGERTVLFKQNPDLASQLMKETTNG